VKVSLTADESNLLLTVSDNGAGIAAVARTGNGIGLVSMRERATALGGKFNIAGVLGAGTTIAVTLPLTRSVVLKEEA
jgi:signal transduction histidine kinase